MFLAHNITIVIANPAGNITAFVENAENTNHEERAYIANKILNEKKLQVEQLGFVIKPKTKDALWHLEMAGGEFCGNAARSFALYAASASSGCGCGCGCGKIEIEISGYQKPLLVCYSIKDKYPSGELCGSASLAMPLPLSRQIIKYKKSELVIYVFEGIKHVIAHAAPSNESFFAIKKIVDEMFIAEHPSGEQPSAEHPSGDHGALGVMFYNEGIMHPMVYVYGIDTLCHESSCGSGSAAFAVEYFINSENTDSRLDIKQPGGTIETAVVKKNGELVSVTIGGDVTLLPRIPLP
jgi:diaminopimelate epimerase